MFIRYNSTLKFWEYDTSGAQNGTGPWVKLQVDAGQLIGTIPVGQLPTNVALRDQVNTFTQFQNINIANPSLILFDPGQPVDLRSFRIVNSGQLFYIQALSDAGVGNNGYLALGRQGNALFTGTITERNRSVPIGEWLNWTPTWNAYGGGTGTIGNGVLQCRYTVIGKIVFYTIRLAWGSTTVGAPSYWAFTLPPSYPPVSIDITGSVIARQATTGQSFIGNIITGAYYYSISNSIGASMHSAVVPSYDTYLYNTVPWTWAVNDNLWMSGFYETT